MKTKLEILEETKKVYADPSNCGYDHERNTCTYYDKNTGNMCAVGRCMVDVGQFEGCGDTFRGVVNDHFSGDHDSPLKEEYRGHELEFWVALQELHDEYAMKCKRDKDAGEYLYRNMIHCAAYNRIQSFIN